MKDVIVLITHLLNETVYERYMKLRNELSKDKYDVILLVNNYKENFNDSAISSIPQNILHYHQTKEKIDNLVNNGYYVHANLKDDFIWINLHLVYLDFYLEHKDKYDNFYYIEYDVVFNGNWSLLFDDIEKHPEIDFLAAKFRKFFTRDPWWWYREEANTINVPMENRWGSFNAFFKISHKAFDYLCEKLHQSTGAFHELSLITYLKQGNFNCVSLWPKNYDSVEDLSGKYCSFEIFDFQSHSKMPQIIDNKLYHPIK